MFPIGIDTEAVATEAKNAAQESSARRLRDSVNGRDLIIGVDRLDYTKGLVQRIEAPGRASGERGSLRH